MNPLVACLDSAHNLQTDNDLHDLPQLTPEERGAFLRAFEAAYPELGKIVASWPTMDAALRAVMAAMADTAEPEGETA